MFENGFCEWLTIKVHFTVAKKYDNWTVCQTVHKGYYPQNTNINNIHEVYCEKNILSELTAGNSS